MTDIKKTNTLSVIVENKYSLKLAKRFITPKNKILDIGCGGEEFLCQLQKEGFNNLFGIDTNIPPELNKNIDFKKINICYENLPYENNFFDLITAWEVFEHLEKN